MSRVASMAIIWGGEVRMANLCVCACSDGQRRIRPPLRDPEEGRVPRRLSGPPEKFTNVTNGVDHRRWLSQINPKLDALIRDCTGGDAYLLHPETSPGWRSTPTTPPC